MKSTLASFWDQTQLALLRSLSIFLGLMDRILNVRWGEQMLARMAEGWQARPEKLDREIAALEVMSINPNVTCPSRISQMSSLSCRQPIRSPRNGAPTKMRCLPGHRKRPLSVTVRTL